MSAKNVFKAYLFPDPAKDSYDPTSGDDITSGILNVDIVFGNEIYEGPWQQVDTGQFTIVSRNPSLDPKINPNLNYNSRISFYDTRTNGGGEFFRGYVTDIDVQYQRNDDPIITITGTDIFGILQRTLVDQTMYNNIIAMSTGPTWDGIGFEEFCNDIGGSIAEFADKYLDTTNLSGLSPWLFFTSYEPGVGGYTTDLLEPTVLLGRSPARYIPEVGETLLEVINKYAQTNLNYLSARGTFGYGFMDVYPFPKYNGYFWNPQEDPALQFPDYTFSSDPSDNAPYQSIIINNGYNRLTNQIDMANEYKILDGTETTTISDNFGPITATAPFFIPVEPEQEFPVSKASLSTYFAPSRANLANATTRYARDIFQLVAVPTNEIQQITFNNSRYEDVEDEFSYSSFNLNQFVRIKHQLNSTEIIDRFYDIAGIKHSITPDEWNMTFTLKPSVREYVFNYQGYKPRIEMNSLTGDTNFNFTGTIVDYPIENIAVTQWCLNAPEANNGAFYYPSTVNFPVERYKDGIIRSGLTQTWNFDDDGILAAYDFETNKYGGYGPGIWTVYCYIVLTNGFVIIAEETLTVGTPVVEADFGWTQNLTNNFGQVSFIDTSVNNETGEPDSYFWDFGDGTTSTERNPVKVYDPSPSTTTYDVSLTVFAYSSGGTKIPNTKTQTITLVQPTMVANFTWEANAQVVTFTNTSTNVGFEEPDAYLWDFGDGTTSTAKNPIHTFPVTDVNVPQSFNVTLTTRNIWEQTASTSQTITTIALNESGTFPVRYIKFSIDPYQKSGNVPSGGEHVTITPVMSVFKAITSGTGANLVYLKPLIGFNDNSIPRLFWLATSGQNVQQNLGWEYFLTRDIQTNANTYGLGAASRNSFPGVPYNKVRWELVVDIGTNTQLIKDIILRFEDLIDLAFPGQILTETFYPKINIEFANTVTNYTPNPSGTFGPPTLNGNWVNVGYIKLDGGRMDPTKPVGQRTNTTKTIFKMRPLPLNIPYFNYTFNDKIVSFTSVETADSYAWDFGDGTTSTLKDPVKTYAAYGTYTVTLAVTNGGVVTRTTTEPVIVQAPVI